MIQFNPWKHHLEFIKNEIQIVIKSEKHPLVYLADIFKNTGNTVTDLYTGLMPIQSIKDRVESFIMQNNIDEKNMYIKWLNNSNSYRVIELIDTSQWVVRLSKDEKHFVHIHPAKHSVNTLRVKTYSLITAIIVNAHSQLNNEPLLELQNINELRTVFLNISPIKSISPQSGVGKIINLIAD